MPSLSRIPTGFRPIAQGCAHRATLGNDRFKIPTPTGLCPDEQRGLLQKHAAEWDERET